MMSYRREGLIDPRRSSYYTLYYDSPTFLAPVWGLRLLLGKTNAIITALGVSTTWRFCTDRKHHVGKRNERLSTQSTICFEAWSYSWYLQLLDHGRHLLQKLSANHSTRQARRIEWYHRLGATSSLPTTSQHLLSSHQIGMPWHVSFVSNRVEMVNDGLQKSRCRESSGLV
jgi:hypothetical protein